MTRKGGTPQHRHQVLLDIYLKAFAEFKMDVLIPVVNSFIVVDADGDRLMAKYYDNKPKAEQLKFEAMLHKKTKAINAKVDGKDAIILVKQIILTGCIS